MSSGLRIEGDAAHLRHLSSGITGTASDTTKPTAASSCRWLAGCDVGVPNISDSATLDMSKSVAGYKWGKSLRAQALNNSTKS